MLVFYPSFALRDCQHCLKWQYDENTGRVGRNPTTRKAMLRYSKPLCQTDWGCVKGTPENPIGFSKQNQQAFEHYLECKEVGIFPDDGVVRRNARVISKALAEAKAEIGD